MDILAGLVGLFQGLLVGGAVIALINTLKIIPRLNRVFFSKDYDILKGISILAGALLASFANLFDLSLFWTNWSILTLIGGLIMGMFVGILVSALSDALDGIPMVAGKVGIGNYTRLIMLFLAIGKVAGSLLFWIRVEFQL